MIADSAMQNFRAATLQRCAQVVMKVLCIVGYDGEPVW